MLSPEEEELIEKVFRESKQTYPFLRRRKDFDEAEKYWDNAHILAHYSYIETFDLFGGSQDHIHYAITKVGYSIPNGKHNLGGYDLQIIASKKLDANYGHILIRPETLEDKFRELFYRLETDFEFHKKFSARYYFLSEDKALGFRFATDKRLALIAEFEGIHMEIIGHRLLAKYTMMVDSERALSLIRLVENL